MDNLKKYVDPYVWLKSMTKNRIYLVICVVDDSHYLLDDKGESNRILSQRLQDVN
jgi:hypothetical protein